MRHFKFVQFLRIAVVASLGASSSSQAGVREFAERHCMDCHDSSTRKAGLDLEKLDLSLAAKKNAMTWETVFDRVANGEMPPKKKAQPSAEECTAFLSELGKELRTASLARQETNGRAPVRRLTRAEYETTVNDLLHIRTDLRSLFPDDAVTAGFDKVGEGLTLSAAHFAAYQQAAEKALNSAILRGGTVCLSEDGAATFNRRAKEYSRFGGWLEGDAMALASRFFYPYTTVLGPEAPRSGRYRLTFTAQARGNGGKPLPIAIGIYDRQTAKPDAPETSRWFDIPEETPRTMSTELDVEERQFLHLSVRALSTATSSRRG